MSISYPDCNISGIKPTITENDDSKNKNGVWRRCCICGAKPTKMASYPIQGAIVIQRYCTECAEKVFA